MNSRIWMKTIAFIFLAAAGLRAADGAKPLKVIATERRQEDDLPLAPNAGLHLLGGKLAHAGWPHHGGVRSSHGTADRPAAHSKGHLEEAQLGPGGKPGGGQLRHGRDEPGAGLPFLEGRRRHLGEGHG